MYVGTQELLEPGKYREVWDGAHKERPLPDGEYQFSVRATDLAGNTVLTTVPVTVAASRPDARVLRIAFTPRRLMLGDELQVEAVVRNVGIVPLRTPRPAQVRLQRLRHVQQHRRPPHVDRVGVWRIGVDWVARRAPAARSTPTAGASGVTWSPARSDRHRSGSGWTTGRTWTDGRRTKNWIFLYGGLIHEGIAFQDDKVGGTWIEVGWWWRPSARS